MTSSTSTSEVERRPSSLGTALVRGLGFVGVCLVVYVVVIAALTISVRGRPLLWWLAALREPGGFGHSLERFREADASGPVDVVFLGSSHAYRGFDPRIFAAHGISSFNLGSTSQSPIQSYWLLHRYIERMRPRLVVLEISWELLGLAGWESTADLMSNTPVSRELAGLTLAMHMPETTNVFVGKLIHDVDLDAQRQQEIPFDHYVPGGFVQRSGPPELDEKIEPHDIEPRAIHLAYLRRSIELARQHGVQIVFVTQPIPQQSYEAVTNRAELHATLAAIAREGRTDYLEFQNLGLDQRTYYNDNLDHLNQAGVERFNGALIDELQRRGLLPRH